MNRVHYKPRNPRFADNKCETTHYDTKENKFVTKPKERHKTMDDAVKAAKVMNIKDTTLIRVVAYKCNTCGFYHIGKNGKPLTKEDKEKIKKELDFEYRVSLNKLKAKGKVGL